MPLTQVKVYYLQMFAPTIRDVPAPRDEPSIIHAKKPGVAYYRFLYNAVGTDYHWYSRGRLADTELAAILNNPGNEVHVLHVDGSPAGFAELDCRDPHDIELVQFGLMPVFIGKGLGKYFLQWTINYVWRRQPRRFWLHTCTLDHAAALPNYLKGGFVVYKEETIERNL